MPRSNFPSARPAPFKGPFSELWRYMCWGFLKIMGWKIDGDWPRDQPKLVIIAAPHTVNMDGINMLAAAGYYRIKLSWMGKASLVKGPFGGIVRWLGCVPVDRSQANDLVAQMKVAFDETSSLFLAIPPEGTRALVAGWRTGFYHIAHMAGVPILPTVLDYGSKTIRLGDLFDATGDIDTDLPQLKAVYRGARGKKPRDSEAVGEG
ncbi:MAG: 1-acyl-sn-glycerol-3-phosphate acyltransferase [Pseudomonadota bacterium]